MMLIIFDLSPSYQQAIWKECDIISIENLVFHNFHSDTNKIIKERRNIYEIKN